MGARTTLAVFNRRVDSLLQGIAESVLSGTDRDFAIREAIQEYNQDAPRRTVVEFPGDAGAYYLLHGKVVNIAESNRDAGLDLQHAGTTTDEKLAIQFTLDRTYTVRSFAFYLRRTGSAVEGDLIGEIYTDGSDLPVSLIATAERVKITTDEGAPEGRDAKVEFTLSDLVTLPAGTYHAVLRSEDYAYANGTNEVILGVQQSGTPTNTVSAFDGTIWAAYGTDSAGILEVTASTPGWRSIMGVPIAVEYPAADLSADEAPNELEDDQWEVSISEEGAWLYFPQHRPSANETIRVTIADPYEWVEGSIPSIDTPPQHFEAVSYLAASLCCVRLASKFGQKRSSTLSADVADRSRQGTFYRAQAKTFKSFYEKALGVGDAAPSVRPGVAVLDMDLEPPQSGGFLFHQKRTR